MTDTQKTHYADPDTLQRMMQMERQLRDLRRALGVYDGDHERALNVAQRAIEAEELLEWAEGQELELFEGEQKCNLRFWYSTGDGTLSYTEFHGPYLADALRQAREWEEREHE